ncbi:hypothetical protein MHBO_001065 [Bonamia ostreae]|uniref:Uncharacterized protein n=1 Tax=Bonamia ostreae TaxID=126728 RepID=A0ABV2AHQ3_9EUKA
MSGFLIEEQKLEIRTFDNSIRFNSWMRLKSKTAKTEKDQNSIRLNFSNKSIKIEKIFVNKTFLNNKNDYKILNNKKILAKTQLQNFAEVQKAFTKILEKRKEGNLLINIPKSDCNLAQIELDIVYSINLAKCKNDVGLKVEPKPNFQILSYNSNWIPKIENEKSMKKFCLNFSCDDENIVVFNGEKTAQKRKAKKMTNFSFSSNFNNNFDYNKIRFVCGDFEQYFFVHEKTEFLFVYPKNKSINPESFKFVKRAIAVYEDFLCTEYPFDRQYFCFVDKSVNPITNCHKLIVLDSKYLYSEKDIDLVFSSRKNIALAIAKNWCQKIFPPSSDQWISLALSEYLRSLFIADEFGPNFCEYRKFSSRFDWKNDYVHHSLSNSNKTKLSNFDKNLEKRIRKKGFLILSLIEIIIGKTEFKSFFKGLALSNEIVKTEKFEQNLISKVPSRQIKDVFDNYIYNNNVPVYMVDISFDSRKRVVGLKMENVSKNVLQKDFSFSKVLKIFKNDKF